MFTCFTCTIRTENEKKNKNKSEFPILFSVDDGQMYGATMLTTKLVFYK